ALTHFRPSIFRTCSARPATCSKIRPVSRACSCSASRRPAHDPEKWEPVFGRDHALMKENPMPHRCAILDDYQSVSTKLADWSQIADLDIKVFNEPFADQKA